MGEMGELPIARENQGSSPVDIGPSVSIPAGESPFTFRCRLLDSRAKISVLGPGSRRFTMKRGDNGVCHVKGTATLDAPGILKLVVTPQPPTPEPNDPYKGEIALANRSILVVKEGLIMGVRLPV